MIIPASAACKITPLVRIVVKLTGISSKDIRSDARFKDIIQARHVAIFLARRFTSYSLPNIGRRIGGRDHTTILHAVRKMAALVERIGEPAEDTPEAWARHLLGSR